MEIYQDSKRADSDRGMPKTKRYRNMRCISRHAQLFTELTGATTTDLSASGALNPISECKFNFHEQSDWKYWRVALSLSFLELLYSMRVKFVNFVVHREFLRINASARRMPGNPFATVHLPRSAYYNSNGIVSVIPARTHMLRRLSATFRADDCAIGEGERKKYTRRFIPI